MTYHQIYQFISMSNVWKCRNEPDGTGLSWYTPIHALEKQLLGDKQCCTAPVTRSLLSNLHTSTSQHEQIIAVYIYPEELGCEWICCWRKENKSQQVSLARLPRSSWPWRQGRDIFEIIKFKRYYLTRNLSVEEPSSAPATSSLRPTASWTSAEGTSGEKDWSEFIHFICVFSPLKGK